MSNWRNVTLGDLGKGLSRYWPFIAVVAAVVLVVGFLPGNPARDPDAVDIASGGDESFSGDSDEESGTDGALGEDGVDGGSTGPTGDGGGDATAGGPGSGGGVSGSGIGGGPLEVPAGETRNCDPATGRIKVPSKFTPPCVPFAGKNGGNTYTGVTGDKITVVVYDAKSNPTLDAALTAAGANNTFEERQDTFRSYIDMINKNYELQGRQIDLKFFKGTADADEDDKGRADAIAVAGMKPFIVIGHINNAFVDELVARKIVCVCTTSVPNDFYEKRSPYVGYTYLMSSTQGYVHRSEYICKRVAGKKAKWAGFRDGPTDPMSDEDRVFGLLYYETADNAYRSGIDGFEKNLADGCGLKLKSRLAYNGYPDIDKTQEQARPLITKLKSEGVNSVIFSGDPFAPAFFTNEAAQQNWQPEWIITGSALTDTNLFARTYNQDQWSRAFGISFLTISIPESQREGHALHTWHTGRPPAAANQYGVLWSPVMAMGIGLHMAGPDLTPQSFQAGMFRYPVTGHGFVSSATISWGKQKFWGGLVDFTAADDVAEIWWDPTAVGEDEVGNRAAGMYRWVQGGKRYLPGEHPRSEPGAFNTNGAPTQLDSRPPNETPPQYPPKRG